jgi:hypothetical protein
MTPQPTAEQIAIHDANNRAMVEASAPSAMELIAAVIRDQSITTDKVEIIERLSALMERQQAQTRKERFQEALRLCQMEMPRVEKNGLIALRSGGISYARLEDLDACIRPIYQGHGFSVAFDAPMAAEGGKIRNVARFSCAGHTETIEITAAASNRSAGNLALTDAQKVKQTITECRRHLLEMFFNVITVGADDPPKDDLITENQALDIHAQLTDINADMAKFNRLFDVTRLEELRASQLTEVYARIKQAKEKRA